MSGSGKRKKEMEKEDGVREDEDTLRQREGGR